MNIPTLNFKISPVDYTTLCPATNWRGFAYVSHHSISNLLLLEGYGKLYYYDSVTPISYYYFSSRLVKGH